MRKGKTLEGIVLVGAVILLIFAAWIYLKADDSDYKQTSSNAKTALLVAQSQEARITALVNGQSEMKAMLASMTGAPTPCPIDVRINMQPIEVRLTETKKAVVVNPKGKAALIPEAPKSLLEKAGIKGARKKQ